MPPSPRPAASVILDARMVGRIACASFPSNCTATLSVLEPGTAVDDAWRPSEADPVWLPDYRGRRTTDHFLPMPVGDVPALTPGSHLLVASLLGVSDVPSVNPDGTEATDMLGRCSADVDVAAGADVVVAVVTFAPTASSLEATCSIEVEAP
jgi:hypothetical protein